MIEISKNTLQQTAEIFKLLGDQTRLAIVCKLFNGNRCVNKLSEELEMTASAISHQLRNLKQMRVVSCIKAGKHVVYSLKDDHIITIITQAVKHISE